MRNKEKLKKLIKKYDEDLTAKNYSEFAPELLRWCGSIVMRKIEDELGTFISYYRDRYVIIDDVVFSTDKKKLVRYSPEKTDEEYVIPDCVEKICDAAFQGSEHLKRVTISKNIRHIGFRAFDDSSSLAEIVWDTPKATGENYVFVNCPKLKKVITDDVQKLWGYCCDNEGSPFINGACLMVDGEVCENLSIPDEAYITLRAFQGCTSIENVEFKENNEYIKEFLLSFIENKGILI